jgi:hypothetical protein
MIDRSVRIPMIRSYKILGALLIAAMLAGFAPTRDLSAAAPPGNPAPGCHERGGKDPTHMPDRDCCLTGHDVAVVKVFYTPRPDGHRAQMDQALILSEVQSARVPVKLSLIYAADPPSLTPLRI